MFCPNCGTKIDEGAVFCPECGNRIAEAAAPVEPAVVPAEAAAPVEPAAVPAEDEMTVSLEPAAEVSEQLPEEAPYPAEDAGEQPEEVHEEAGYPEEQPAEQPVYVQEEPPVYQPEEPPVYQPEEPPVYTPPVYEGGNAAPEPAYEGPIESPPVKLLKKSARSGAFLAGVLAFTVSVVLTILTIIQNRITTEWVEDLIGNFGSSVGEDITEAINAVVELFGGTIDSLGTTILITGLLAMVPTILTMIALWVIFGSALGRNNERMGTSGFTIIKVIWIIKLILTALLVVAVLVLGIIAYTMYQESSEDIINEIEKAIEEVPEAGEWVSAVTEDITSYIDMAFLISAVVFAVISAVVILFQIKVITTLGAVQRTAETGDNRKKVSAFVAVMLFIGAFYALHALPSMIISTILFPSQMLFAAIAFCAEVAAYICFGIAIFSYRVKVRILNVTGKTE